MFLNASFGIGALVSAFVVTMSATISLAQENRATFPKDFDQYVLYGTYDRGASKEEAFAKPETIAIAKSGQPLPAGTQLVLGIWTNYTLTGYFVMEKGMDWGLDFAERDRTGDWHFQQFDAKGKLNRTAIAERCQACHRSQSDSDFMFTIDRMRAYLP